MKKGKSQFFVCISLLVCFSVLLCGSAFGLEPMGQNGTSNGYTYPIVPNTPEWKEIKDHSVKVKMLQIPNEVIANMDTSSLITSVMDYPLLSDMLYYDNYNTGYEKVKEHFNGLQRLAERPDAASQLLGRYRSRRYHTDSIQSLLLQVIIQQKDYLGVMSPEELASYNSTFDATSHTPRLSTTTVKTPKATPHNTPPKASRLTNG